MEYSIDDFRKLSRSNSIVFVTNDPTKKGKKPFPWVHGSNLNSPNLRVKTIQRSEFDQEWLKKDPKVRLFEVKNAFKPHDFYCLSNGKQNENLYCGVFVAIQECISQCSAELNKKT